MPVIICQRCGTASAGVAGESIPLCGQCLGRPEEQPFYVTAKRRLKTPVRPNPMDLEDDYGDESGPDDVCELSPHSELDPLARSERK